VYNPEIPVGVKVPAYAYQDVSISNIFNVTLAQDTRGTESSRLPSTSTSVPTQVSFTKTDHTPMIIGGVVGGLIGLGLVAALITYLVIRSRRKQDSTTYSSSTNDRSTNPSASIDGSAQNRPPQTMPQYTGGYSGMPEP